MSLDSQRVQSLFLAAVEAGTPAARAALLERECGADAELRQRVEALLRAHDESGSFLDEPVSAFDDTVDDPIRERPGTEIVARQMLLPQTLQGLSDRGNLLAALATTDVEPNHVVDEAPPAAESALIPPAPE